MRKLVFVTQQVDAAHPTLGAAAALVRALAERVDEVVILAASASVAELPASASHGPLRIEYRWVNELATAQSDAQEDDPPIAVFLHEGLGSIAMWRDWPQMLCERLGMRGLVYSRPGYGLSTPRAPRNGATAKKSRE